AVAPSWYSLCSGRLSFRAIVARTIVRSCLSFVAGTVLAGLLAVPRELREAALIAGAGAWKRFWHVTFPVLRPVFAVVTILSTIWDFQVFAQIYLMPGGDVVGVQMINLGMWAYVLPSVPNDPAMRSADAVWL